MGAIGFVIIFCLGAAILWCIYTYNTFRDKQSQIDFWWDEVDVHLHLRRDLIPSLIDRARPLMREEISTLDRIMDIREKMVHEEIAAKSIDIEKDAESLENRLSSEMHSLQDSFKKQREIQMNANLLTVMGELVSIEGRAITACEEYNKLAVGYNTLIKKFPAKLVARWLHFNPREKRIFGEPV
ncbi:MAG: LemA family protein [Synergistaceae bacterium]|jgi:LemA protein|nr:LemA family protein [Synergistaceae bacterium]